MAKFKWTDELAIEFARVATNGPYGEYRGLRKIKEKLEKFKEIHKKEPFRPKCPICGRFVSPTGVDKDRVRVQFTLDSYVTVEKIDYVHIKCMKYYNFN